MNYFKHTTLFLSSILGTLLVSNFLGTPAIAQDIVNVGGNEEGIFDWTEAKKDDLNGWENGTTMGYRNDLSRVYFHQPSGKYVKVSVNAQFRWNGGTNDDHKYAPKIVDEAKRGMGGFNQTDMFLFNSQIQDGISKNNSLTIEFFEDANLTKKASVENLNFTLTDLDTGHKKIGGVSLSSREKINVNAIGISGDEIPVQFYRPEGSLIDSSSINGGSVLGYEKGTDTALGNIAPVLVGETHKIEIAYIVDVNIANPSYGTTRNMYVSDLAWGGYTIKVTPDEKVDLSDIVPEAPPNNAPDAANDNVTSFAWKDPVVDLLANDSDPDNADEDLIITHINNVEVVVGEEIIVPGGTVIVNSDYQMEYYSNNLPGEYSFNYTISDSQGSSGSANINMNLLGYAD